MNIRRPGRVEYHGQRDGRVWRARGREVERRVFPRPPCLAPREGGGRCLQGKWITTGSEIS
jgi:hypothetical protein